MTQSDTIGNLALALSKAQAELNGAVKSSDNPFFKSKYADLHECIQCSKEALSKNELSVVQTTDPGEGGRILVHTTLCHSSGEWIRGTIEMRPKKDDDQAVGSSITYGRRYGYAAIVGLAQKDDDGNGSCDNDNKDHGKKQDQSNKKPEPKPEQKNKPRPAPPERKSVDFLLQWASGFLQKKKDGTNFKESDVNNWWNANVKPYEDTFTEEEYMQLVAKTDEIMLVLMEKENA